MKMTLKDEIDRDEVLSMIDRTLYSTRTGERKTAYPGAPKYIPVQDVLHAIG